MEFYNFILAVLAAVVAIVSLYYQREAVRLMKAAAVSPRQRKW
jgi:hypothetical protein